MAKRKNLAGTLAQLQREAARAQLARERAQAAASRRAEAAQRAYERASAAEQKEQKRAYLEARQAQVDLDNDHLDELVRELQSLLVDCLKTVGPLDMESFKRPPELPVWKASAIDSAEAPPARRSPPPAPSGLHKLSRRAKEAYLEQLAALEARYQQEMTESALREKQRRDALERARTAFEDQIAAANAAATAQHAEIDQLQAQVEAGDAAGILGYFALVIEASSYPLPIVPKARLAYVPESKQLVVEYELPQIDAVPDVGQYRYTKASDKVIATSRPAAQRKSLYTSLIAQITLRTLREVFSADAWDYVDTIVFNGHVDTINPGTGHPEHPCLITVRTSKEIFDGVDLRLVDPIACLKSLNASVSKNAAELAPVRPVLDFNMVDPRFIESTDVLGALDDRPNLMELTPSEFEGLITNLFEKMGLETRLTQASRDGGVDCVAYDPRPIFGGKVVIQAKRYRHTVGVSAVRDLYGTMQNEGASKGILVTTSGYGKASFEFADGKPLELLSGSNLLYLLSTHAGIEARIEPPDDWQDPQTDQCDAT